MTQDMQMSPGENAVAESLGVQPPHQPSPEPTSTPPSQETRPTSLESISDQLLQKHDEIVGGIHDYMLQEVEKVEAELKAVKAKLVEERNALFSRMRHYVSMNNGVVSSVQGARKFIAEIESDQTVVDPNAANKK